MIERSDLRTDRAHARPMHGGTRMSIHEIRLPETKPQSEWVRGRPVQKVSGTYEHAALQAELAAILRPWVPRVAAALGCPAVTPDCATKRRPSASAIRRDIGLCDAGACGTSSSAATVLVLRRRHIQQLSADALRLGAPPLANTCDQPRAISSMPQTRRRRAQERLHASD